MELVANRPTKKYLIRVLSAKPLEKQIGFLTVANYSIRSHNRPAKLYGFFGCGGFGVGQNCNASLNKNQPWA
jgi:hypothetical protein